MEKYCVYFHKSKLNNVVFYVGIGNYKRPYSKRSRTKFWKNVSEKHGYIIDIVHKELTFEEACELEIYYIRLFGRLDISSGTLVNLTDGGEGSVGYKHTDESKEKIKKHWEEYRGFKLPECIDDYKREYSREYVRKYREREEVKERYRQLSRERYSNMNDLEREEYKKRQKSYKDKLTEEQKEKKREYHINYKKNMSEEKKEQHRIRNRERMRKKRQQEKQEKTNK